MYVLRNKEKKYCFKRSMYLIKYNFLQLLSHPNIQRKPHDINSKILFTYYYHKTQQWKL